MKMSDFKQAREFARKYGAKSMVYGKPGVGKTPVANTAPRPLMVVCEPGMLSMRSSTIPAIDCFTPERIDEFFEWLFTSREAANFDTIVMDSVSQMAEIYLDRELNGKSKSGAKVDGRAAYGNMSRAVMKHINGLFFMQNKHTYLICKQGYKELDNVTMRVPYFPGQELPTKIPHLYDVILNMDVHSIPSVGQQVAFRCRASYDSVARDRSGNLNEFEPCDLTALFNKIML